MNLNLNELELAHDHSHTTVLWLAGAQSLSIHSHSLVFLLFHHDRILPTVLWLAGAQSLSIHLLAHVTCGLDLPDVENLSDIQHRWIFNSEIQVRHDTFVSYPADQTLARLVRALERIDSQDYNLKVYRFWECVALGVWLPVAI